MKKTLLHSGFFFALLISFAPLMAQPNVKDSLSIPKEEKSVTRHSVTIDGKLITYTATAGALILRNEQDEPIAFYGYTAYTKDGQSDLSKRPITFSYNGGPGSSSIWLHMGVMGPKGRDIAICANAAGFSRAHQKESTTPCAESS